MNPLAAFSIDQNSLVGENPRFPGGIFYPSIHPLSAQKPQEPGPAVRLGYDLLYKPDGPSLEGQKTLNGCVELFKNLPPGMQKPLLIPAADGNGLGLNSHIVSVDKQSELGLNGTSDFVRVPWITPYGDASMYPFLDMAYKASFLSQQSSFIQQQQLVYQSLCATGSLAPGNERLFYVPPFAPPHIGSSLGPQIRMSSANPAPAVLSPLPHSQDKALQGHGPQLHQETSTFSSNTKIHQEPRAGNHTERQHVGSSGEKTCQLSSTKNTLSSGAHGNSASTSQPSCSVPSLHSLSSNTVDFQKPLYKNVTSSSVSPSVSHPFCMNSQHSSSMHSGSIKTKDASSDSHDAEAYLKTLPDRNLPQKVTKNAAEKTDSAKEFNEFPSKVEALTNLGYLPPSDYKLLLNQEQHLKQGSAPFNLSANVSNNDTICTAPSAGVGSCPITSTHNIFLQTVTKSKVDSTHCVQKPQGSHGSAMGQSTNNCSPTSSGLLSANLPKSKIERPQICSAESEKSSSKEEVSSGKPSKTPSKPESPESHSCSPESQQSFIENPSRQIYGDSYLPPGLGCSNHYIPYSVAQNMCVQQISIPSKGPLYHHSLLLGHGKFYPSQIKAKHGLLYGAHPYQSSDKMTVSSVSAFPSLKSTQLESRSKNQEPFRSQEMEDVNHSNRRNKLLNQTLNVSDKNSPVVRDNIICINLVRDEEDEDEDISNTLCSLTEGLQGISGGNHKTGLWPPKTLCLSQSAEQTLSSVTHVPLTKQEVSEDPLGPFSNIPEEQTMQCARTSPWQFTRNYTIRTSRDLTCGGNDADEIKQDASANEHAKPHQSPSKKRSSLVLTGLKSSSSDSNNNIGIKCTVSSSKSPCNGASPPSENPLWSSKAVACTDFSPQVSHCGSFNPKVPDEGDVKSRPLPLLASINPRDQTCNSPNRRADAKCLRNPNLRMSANDPGFFSCSTCENGNLEGSTANSLQVTNSGNCNAIWKNANLRGPFGKGNLSSPTIESTLSKTPTSCASRNLGVPSYENDFSPACKNLSHTNGGFNRVHANMTPEFNSDNETIKTNISCGNDKTDSNVQDDQHEGPGCCTNQQSGLKKSNINLSGYKVDSFKNVTTEIHTDVTELGKNQRALQVRLCFVLFLH